MLVPYDKKYQEKNNKPRPGEQASGGNLSTMLGLGDSRGCCPGQTGHHLVPDSWVKEKCGSKYDKDTAPVVCMEGTSQYFGSHEAIHTGLNKSYEDALAKKAEGDTSVTIGEAIGMASESHQEVYPIDRQSIFNWGTGCEKDCLTAQLTNYYQDKGCDEPLDAQKIGRDGGTQVPEVPRRG
jgi:hypothetical protein